MKTYKEFVNENITKFMTPKSEDDVLKKLEGLSGDDKIEAIIKYQLDFDLLPRDENGICYHENWLDIGQCNITELPDDLIIGDSLHCDNNNLTKLPNNLVVKGNLDCCHNNITELPVDLLVDDDLYCSDNKVKLTLPDDTQVGGNFYN